ncbi:hypothetical protein ACHAP5_011686 [Fusarium lateritium]
MSGSMDITTASDNGKSPDATAATPTKLSLGDLDQVSTNLNTHEQDLAHSPLLLGFGDGQEHAQDLPLARLELELASQASAHYSANESILPSLPVGVPLSSSDQATTLSTLSQSGPLLTVPSSSIGHETAQDPEEQTTSSADQHRPTLAVPWHHEFSWENSHMCFSTKLWVDSELYFNTESLDIVEASEEQSLEASPASESGLFASQASFSGLPAPLSGAGESDPFSTTGIGGFCSSVEVRSTLSLPQDFEMAFMRFSASSDSSEFDCTMENDNIEESSDPVVTIAMEKRAEWVAELLIDDFFRSHARRKSQKQTTTEKDQDLASEPGNDAQGFRGDQRHVKRPRKSKATCREDEGEDDDSGGDEKGPSPIAESSDFLYLACPFLKWNPAKYAITCTLKFRHIRNVKKHLRIKHQQTYCPKCEMIFTETKVPVHQCDPNRVRPRALLTKEKLSMIEATRGSEVEWKEKELWYTFYAIIFPNGPPCFSPYFHPEIDRILGEAKRYLRFPGVRTSICENMQSLGHVSQVEANFCAGLFLRALPEPWERYDANDEGEPCMTYDKEHAAQHASSKTVNPGARDKIISYYTGDDTSQHPHDEMAMPHSCTVTGPTDSPTSMSELFAAQEQSENIANDLFPDLTNSGEFPDPTIRGLMGVCESDSWGMTVGQNFADPSWSAGYEVGSDLMSEP